MEFKNSGPGARPKERVPIKRNEWIEGLAKNQRVGAWRNSNFLRRCPKADRKANPGRIDGGEHFFLHSGWRGNRHGTRGGYGGARRRVADGPASGRLIPRVSRGGRDGFVPARGGARPP